MSTNWLYNKLLEHNINPPTAELISYALTIGIVLLGVVVATVLIRRFLLSLCLRWFKNNKYHWDTPLIDNRVFDRLSWFIPVVTVHLLIDALLPADSSTYVFLKRAMKVSFVLVSVLSVNAVLSTVNDIYRLLRKQRGDVLQGFTDAGKIIVYIIGIIFTVSILSGVTPWGIISVLGGLTAVTMLVFKDTILGFVASIQLTMIDMVRVGDWVEMPSYGADGDVISMSIHTIRVQNWDKTITTIPTYSLVSNSFKNWRGMSDSGGRRIKRAMMIDISSIQFCDQKLLDRLSRIQLLTEYLSTKTQEIAEFNRSLNIDDSDLPINGRRQTNIGVFRAYVIAYLKSNPHLHKDMTFLVRQLKPTETGLPIEIYVFSNDQRWAYYEAIQADIFDHLFAALSTFNLRAFQNPSGYDMQMLGNVFSERPAA